MNQEHLSAIVDKIIPVNPSVSFYRLTYDHYARGFHLVEFYTESAREPFRPASRIIKSGSLQGIHSYIMTNIDLL